MLYVKFSVNAYVQEGHLSIIFPVLQNYCSTFVAVDFVVALLMLTDKQCIEVVAM